MKVTRVFIWIISLMLIAVSVECFEDNGTNDDFRLMVKSHYGSVDDVTSSGRSEDMRHKKREKRSLKIYTNKKDDLELQNNTIIHPEGTNLTITCHSTDRTPHWYEDITKVEEGKRLHSVLFGVDYIIDSLSSDHHRLALTCREEGTTRSETVTILVLPEISLSVFNGESKVNLIEGCNTTLTYTTDVELQCYADYSPPELKLCLTVGKKEYSCEKNSNIISRVDFKTDETLQITCVSSFVDIEWMNTLPKLAFKDVISRTMVEKSVSIQIKVNGSNNASLVVLSTSTTTSPTTSKAQNVSELNRTDSAGVNPLDTEISHVDHKTMTLVIIVFIVLTFILVIGLIYVARRMHGYKHKLTVRASYHANTSKDNDNVNMHIIEDGSKQELDGGASNHENSSEDQDTEPLAVGDDK